MDAPRQIGGSRTVSPDTPITIKITVNDAVKKLHLPLRDLDATTLPAKLRQALGIQPEQLMTLERYSDSAGGYITLDPNNATIYRTLIRAAKAKLKLRIKATVTPLKVPRWEEKTTLEEMKSIDQMAEPLIKLKTARDSTAIDQRSIGTGIFQFREAQASQQTVNDEAPVPFPFNATPQDLFTNFDEPTPKPELAFRTREPAQPVVAQGIAASWSVYCNECDKAMANAHFHCSICDGGDYDLCENCVANGKVCPGENHWLIKRFIQHGKVVNSTTERVQPSKAKLAPTLIKIEPESPKEMPGSFSDDTKILSEEPRGPTRTCNSCVVVLPEREFVTCLDCDDFDLCIKCHTQDRHGHHPAHGFKPATEETILQLDAESKLSAGRNVRHNAICDGCDKKIFGVRHKCLNCPDWDYCNDCIKDSLTTHPRHRFAALYQPIPDQCPALVRHYGIYCDGPLCSKKGNQSYITGVRYKCTICHDKDFCASCEALPDHHHNRTHPLIKFKTPVRNVNISTESEDLRGNVRFMGDRQPQSATQSAASEAVPAPVAKNNVATQVQTVAEITPTEVKPVEVKSAEAVSIPVKRFVQNPFPAPDVRNVLLNAHFVTDSIPDGKVFEPETRFTQVWTLKNPGPFAWPAGCSVRYVGGDNMLNVDNSHPASVSSLVDATESNVIGREVAVGEEVAFKITLKAPKREGKSISYWRIKAADGTPFGHRLWCDIEVKKTEPEVAVVADYLSTEAQMAALRRQAAQLKQELRQNSEVLAKAPGLPPMPSMQPLRPQVFGAPSSMQFPASRPVEPSNVADSMNLASRLAAMREQQKLRREQMMVQLQAQREQFQAHVGKRDEVSWARPRYANVGKSVQKDDMDAFHERAAALKANILKTREERESLFEKLQKESARSAAASVKTATPEKAETSVADSASMIESDEHKEEVENLSDSQMVFPKLEKESPASSTYQSMTSHSSNAKAAYVENEDGEIERSATPNVAQVSEPVAFPSSPVVEDEDDFESLDGEIEVLSCVDNEDSDDDGFVTDEEYDILDASDSETVASK